MFAKSHRWVTKKAFEIAGDIDPSLAVLKNDVAEESVKTDKYWDLEFVDVDGGMDNPHVEDAFWGDDETYKKELVMMVLTAYNHYIDIKKGTGQFDDYDGYSYKKGSASKDQYQTLKDFMGISGVYEGMMEMWARIMSGEDIRGEDKIDAVINKYFTDYYVCAPGSSKWYIYGKCSPSLERYSFYKDKGVYNSKEEENKARFPFKQGGYSHSVFMPVDNLARYWYNQFKKTMNLKDLGPVMHAIQDASVPHHAAGYHGNWHGKYENDYQSKIKDWLENSSFIKDVNNLVKQWNREDTSPPNTLKKNDWKKTPARNWRIDHLVTWVALNAYREYDTAHNHFKNGYKLNVSSMKKLAKIELAMSALVLIKASSEVSLSLIKALKKVGKQPSFSVPSGFHPHPKIKSLKEMMWVMHQGKIPK